MSGATIISSMAKSAKKTKLRKENIPEEDYSKFESINGLHPWQEKVPEGCILYPVRRLNQGRVTYFNFNLAKTMGLISKNHPHKMNKKLHQKIIQMFSLRIINEYDIEKKNKYPKKDIADNKYMATRYLQVQHKSKIGKTSGDGRSIWNGVAHHKGRTWDVNSRGTGVTKLSPGSVKSGKNLRSGNTKHGYGCGLIDTDELYASSILSEIFHNNGVTTERTLAIINIEKNIGIGIRAGENLFRPAHIFMYSKQNRYSELKRSVDFFINRQVQNKDWNFSENSSKKYDHMLEYICDHFAKFSAKMEREYIFAWMGWDGDNILGVGGLIDYGSVRMFGLRHDSYRFNDDGKMSTTLSEQKREARLIVQIFAQVLDYIKNKKKTPIHKFNNHSILKKFDEFFLKNIYLEFLRQMGLNEKQQHMAINNKLPLVKKIYSQFYYLEKIKTYKKQKKISDGVNRPPIFNTRSLFRILPQTVSLNKSNKICFSSFEPKELQTLIASAFATKQDLKMSRIRKTRLKEIQINYYGLMKYMNAQAQIKFNLSELKHNSQLINRKDRITGNALILIVNKILKSRKWLDYKKIQMIIDNLIVKQSPQKSIERSYAKPLTVKSPTGRISETLLSIVKEYSEEI